MTISWKEVPLKPSPTWIDFDLDTGVIKTIGATPLSKHSIEVDYEQVKDLIEGKVYFKHFLVQFNPTSTLYELVNKHDEKKYEYNVNSSLYKIQNTDKADIIICKNYKKKQWELKFGDLFAKTLLKNNVTLQTVKHFSVVEKNNPFVLYRTLTFNLAANDLVLQFNDNDAIIEFDIYTNKLFNSYGIQIEQD
jgi:hypothetical protein